jgi:DNA invertase Pin-like site-specific DNA recombinase
MPNMVGVIRVSTDEQAGVDGEGLERQRATLRGLGVRPEDWFEVTGVSGSDLADTPVWRDQIVPRIQAGHDLAADSIDRLIRADAFDFRVFQAVRASAGRIVTPTCTYNTMDQQDVLFLTMFAGVGGFEKAEIKRRAQAGKEAARKRGQWVSRLDAVPLGTVYDRPNRRWEHDPQTVSHVVDAFRLVARGGSNSEAARVLGVTVAGARVILTNPIYRGLLVYSQKRGAKYPKADGRQPGRRKVNRPDDHVIEVRVFGLDGQAQQIIPDDLWETVQARLQARTTSRRKNKAVVKDTMTYSGILRPPMPVPTDGIFQMGDPAADKHVLYGRVTAKRPDLPKHVAYICRCMYSSDVPRCAAPPRLPADLVNRAVDTYLTRMSTDLHILESIVRDIKAHMAVDTTQAERARLTRDLLALDEKEKKVTDLHVDGRLSRDAHDQRQDKLIQARKVAQAALSRLETTPALPAREELVALAKKWVFDPAWAESKKRDWCRTYAPSITVDSTGIQSVVIRLPTNGAGLATPWSWSGSPLGAMTWEALLGVGIDPAGRRKIRGQLGIKDAAVELGTTGNRLAYLIRSGQIPQPSIRVGTRTYWSSEDVARARCVIDHLKTVEQEDGQA